MSDARRHHFVPACYLRHFAIPQDRYQGRLYVYDRVTGRRFGSSPDKSARERDFYRVVVQGDETGEKANTVEDELAKLDDRFGSVIAGVNERGTLPKDPLEMRELYAFVASQAARTPRIRRVQEKFYSDTWMLWMQTLADDKDAFMSEFRRDHSELTDAELDEMYAEHCAFVKAKGARVEMDQTTLIRDALEAAVLIEDLLAKRFWVIGVAPGGARFITTDDPVNLQPASSRGMHPLWSPGFDDANTVVLVSIGPRLLLLGLPSALDRARVRLTRLDVAQLNTDFALSAHRFIYSTEPTFLQVEPGSIAVEGPTDALLLANASKPSPRFGFFGEEHDRRDNT